MELRNRKPAKRSLPVFVLVTLLLASMAVGFATSMRNAGIIGGRTREAKGPIRTNILLMGIDERKRDTGRSDAIMLLSIDEAAESATITSIPRDSLVELDGKGFTKINHAYGYGGPEMVRNAVAKAMDTDIDGYVAVNFKEFEELVDSVGGVEVDVKQDLKYVDKAGGLYIDIKKGRQTLDGHTALGFVRFRHDRLNDFGRMIRQHELLMALIGRIKGPRAILKGIGTIEKTDLSTGDAMRLLPVIRNRGKFKVGFETAKGESKRLPSGWYYILDSNRDQVAGRFDLDWNNRLARSPQPQAEPIAVEPIAPAPGETRPSQGGVTITPVEPQPAETQEYVFGAM